MWDRLWWSLRRRWRSASALDAWQGRRTHPPYPPGDGLLVIGCRCGGCPEHGSRLAATILDRPSAPTAEVGGRSEENGLPRRLP